MADFDDSNLPFEEEEEEIYDDKPISQIDAWLVRAA